MKNAIKADKISGLESNLFSMSMVLEIMPANNRRNKFKIPFYGLTYSKKAGHVDEWIQNDLYLKETERLLNYVTRNGVGEFIRIKHQAKKESDLILKESQRLTPLLHKMDIQRLIFEYKRFMQNYINFFGLGVITFIYEHIVSEKFDQNLRNTYGLTTAEVSALMQNSYTSFMIDSEKLLHKINFTKNIKFKNSLVKKYKKEFFFMGSGFTYRKAMTDKNILLAASKSHYQKIHHNKPAIKLKAKDKVVLNLLHQTEAIHDLRKRTNFVGNYTMCRFLDEVIKRQKIQISIAENAFWFEYPELLTNIRKVLPKIKKRREVSMVFLNNKKTYSEKILISARELPSLLKELRGTPASPGVAQGRARVMLGAKDFVKMKSGDILVTEMTRPDFLPVMKKASAIITEEGGLTCHAAIVSRELNIPCIVGVKSATHNLKSGDWVEVDANIGIIKKL